MNENLLPGNPASQWDIPGKNAGDPTIQGFADEISVNRGQTIRFHINTPATSYTARIYRIGYYQGNGARFIANAAITASLPQAQPACITDPVTGLTDCGNWGQSAQWAVPGTAVSGVYLLRLQRTDIATSNCSHIIFVVRNDASTSDLYFQTSDATWQAYNEYGGNSFYTGSTGFPGGRGVKVSYNRPLSNRGGGIASTIENNFFNAEYPMIRWLERNGYDLSYASDVDADRNGSLILNHKALVMAGHNEYWSNAQRTNIETARDAGVHLAFFSGNEVYWKTRYENSIDGNGTPYKTLVCYKEGIGTAGENVCIGKCDPQPTIWTGLWSDGCTFSPANDGCKPGNALSGQIGDLGGTANLQVPDTYKNLRFWRNTTISSLAPGDTKILPYGTLGYEVDYEQFPDSYPNGRITMSSTVILGKTHKLSLYRHFNGGNSCWVFGAGTIQWSWGLDDKHDQGSLAPSKDMQQATVNLFADMGVQPGTLQSDLVAATASTDVTPPTSVITSPSTGSNVIKGSLVTVSGTATDANTVAGTEVSIDGGITWRVATGFPNWSYTFTAPSTLGPITVKSRAYDDNGNMEVPGVSGPNVITLNVIARPSPGLGFGAGPILVVHDPANPFSRYATEILRAEGFNEFDVKDISTVTLAVLNNYDVVVLGEMPLSAGNVTDLTSFVTNGGTLIAFRPDAQLAPLMGITPGAGILNDQYLLVSNTGAGTGIVNQTIQFHGTADFYTLSGATAQATLYSDATTSTGFPAVTVNSVGGSGGQAIAFTFDLAKSIVLTRQGNTAWAGQNRDALGGPFGPIRPNDLFYGNDPGDPQPDWIDFDKVAIPQADEQQHLLSNLILQSNLHRKPLPRFWFLPSAHKAAVIMTGDGHSNGGAVERFEDYYTASGNNNNENAVADWKAIRATVYLYPDAPLYNSQAASIESQGFEIARSLQTNCVNFTPASLAADFVTQLGQMTTAFPGLKPTATHRPDCVLWSDWASMAKKEADNGIHLDMTYYYWPDFWIQDRPGMFTGSGMPMRFADDDGTLIDCYQAPTQITDESGQTIPAHIASLLDKAIGPEGYYGVFGVNMYADYAASTGGDQIIAAAQQRNIPIVSARQMLNWLDGRNNSFFSNMTWSSNVLTFKINTNVSARNLKGMVPALAGPNIRLQSVTKNGTPISFYFETIKGIEYGFFDASEGDFTAIYNTFTCTTPTATLVATPATICNGNGPVTLKLTNTTGTAPYTVVVNGTTYNNVMPNVPFRTFTPNETTIWSDNVVGANPDNVFTPSIELGVKFRSSVPGYVLGIRFYKVLSNGGVHTGSLWTSTGTLLATVTFTNETNSGWQYAKFSSPVFIAANTTYVASYFAPFAQYSSSFNAFQSSGISNGPLTLLQNGVDGPNGVFKYGNGGVFPDDTYLSSNYWVDIKFVDFITSSQTYNYTLSNITDFNNCVNTGPNISTASVTINAIPCGSLPIELLDFNASLVQRKVLLNWITEFESNSAGFEIQRSTDGLNWKAIGYVNGAGTSYSTKKYQFTDASVTAGKYYYRLKQIDLDNKFKYSKTALITIRNLDFELEQNFPNPTKNVTSFAYSVPQRSHVYIALYDMYGRTVRVLVDKTQSTGTYVMKINLSDLPKGEYFYRMQAGDFNSVKKLVVQ